MTMVNWTPFQYPISVGERVEYIMTNIYVISIGVLNIMAVIYLPIFYFYSYWKVGGGVQNIMALINWIPSLISNLHWREGLKYYGRDLLNSILFQTSVKERVQIIMNAAYSLDIEPHFFSKNPFKKVLKICSRSIEPPYIYNSICKKNNMATV